MLPIKLINTTPGPRELKFRRLQAITKFGRGPKLPDSEYFLCACAMVRNALDQNEDIRPLWVDIQLAWKRQGCSMFESFIQTNRELAAWAKNTLEGTILQFPLQILERIHYQFQGKFKNNPDIIYLNNLIDAFILKGFNGPIKPTLRRTYGIREYLRKPKYKILVRPETAPLLKYTILFLSWCVYKGIDLQEIDQERMGADYELVTSVEKPTNNSGRQRKAALNYLIRRNARLSFISEEAIQKGADKWYYARVIKASIVEAASYYGITWPGTLENEIRIFDHIVGLR